MSDLSDVVSEFLIESYENLDQLDRDLVALERDPSEKETLASIFRTIHTIKGTSGFLAFSKLESVTHVGENLLSRLRDGLLVLTPDRTSALLTMVDAVRGILANIEESGQEGDGVYDDLIKSLTALTEDGSSAPAAAPPAAMVVDDHESDDHEESEDLALASATSMAKPSATDLGESGPATDSATHRGSVSDSNIRVDVGLLDRLMNLVGELVLARNQILQWSSGTEDTGFLATTQRLNLITTELQEGVMKTRMQPIGNVWAKFPRVVRDLASTCEKKVRIEMEGKDTELDKTIIESIKDPLTHIVRNSVDHGIESPHQRLLSGKEEEGLLLLRAYHEGGQVNIEIVDDGKGLDAAKIKEKAISRGLLTAEQAGRMSDRELVNLIFLPGFSTAAKVTNVSGRGVGMDVVKTNIEKIGGTVDLQSRPGEGTTLKIKIPLTLAIIPALIVTTGGDRFAIPQVSLLELVRLEGAQARKGIEWIHGAPVYRLRGNLLPLVFLNEQLQLGGPGSSVASLLDFEAARAELRGWLARAREAIKGHGANAPADLPPPAETTLGRWLSSCNDDLNALPTVELLRSACDAFFEGVSKITQAGGKVESHSLVEIESLAEVAAEQIGALQSYLETASSLNIVVLSADDRHFGLVVDEINDTEEIVVKPLSKQLKGLSVFAGATIMGDGRVALILDILGMAQRSGVVSQVRDRTLVDSKPQVHGEEVDKQTLLLVGVGEHGRMAIPLSAVARLEEFSGSTIERTGRDEVVQYRGNILPLLRLSSVLPESGSSHEADPMPVVVYSEDDRSVGLVVDRIIDIVEESVVLQRRSGRSGVLGSAIIQGRVTDVLDVRGLICKADPSFFEAVAA